MTDVGIVVMVEESRRADIDRLATSFENKGLHVQKKLPWFRTIVGTGDSSLLEELKSMDGVEAVRP
jgi:DAHP synthase ferredoxin-like domain